LEPTRIGEEPLAQPRLEPEGSAGGQDRRGPRRGGPPDTTVARRPRLGMPRFPFRQSWASLSAPASGIPSGSTTAEQDAIGKHSAAGTAATARKEMARALYKRSESAPPPPRRPGTHFLAPPPRPTAPWLGGRSSSSRTLLHSSPLPTRTSFSSPFVSRLCPECSRFVCSGSCSLLVAFFTFPLGSAAPGSVFAAFRSWFVSLSMPREAQASSLL
jgi:hypothetical protein